MRTRRILVVLATVLTTGLLTTSTAQAGGWAETVLDPTPQKIESKVTYTFGFWVLQHGSYPFMSGDLGPVALRATDDDGEVVLFRGTSGATDGHYSAEVVFPHDGVWRLGAEHETLVQDDDVATVIVPGGVAVSPSEVSQRAEHEWGVVRPSFPPTDPKAMVQAPGPAPEGEAPVEAPAVAPRSLESAAVDEPGADLPLGLVIGAGLATVALAAWLARRRVRGNRPTG